VLAILSLVAVGFMMWWFLAPSSRFQQGFSRLIDTPRTRRRINTSMMQYESSVAGRFKQREVRLTLLHPAEHRFATIELAMSTHARDGAPWKDTSLLARNPEISRATFDLEGKYELVLTLADGWLRASWSRPGVWFPGPFDEATWRNTLQQMDVLAEWMENRGS
jgi:hypothetical protein